MNREIFLDSFGHFADAPGGVEKLRRLILTLAMCGRLTERHVGDEPASELLARARLEKARLVESGAIRRPKSYPELREDDLPFDIPHGWEWCRTVDLIDTVNGRAFKPAEWSGSGRPIIRIQNLNNPSAPFNYFAGEASGAHIVAPGDLLISWSGTPGTSFGAFVWSGPPGVLNQHIFKCRLFDDYRDFICLAINSRLDVLIGDAHGGVGLQHFTKDKLERLPLAIPPLQEQHRIVERVEELMTLCDELEEQQAARVEARSALTGATLQRLTDAVVVDDLRSAVDSFAENVGLHLAPGDGDIAALKRLRQTILDLAVRGRVARQDAADEPVAALLKRIAEALDSPAQTKRVRKAAAAPPHASGDQAFEIPETWMWSRLGDVCQSRLGKMLDDQKNTGTPRPYLRNTNVQWGRFKLEDIKMIRLEDAELDEYSLRDGDLLVVEGGEPGRCAIWDTRFTDGVMVFQKALHRVRPEGGISSRFLAMVLRNGIDSGRLQELFTGSTIKHLTGEKLKGFWVPLPPVEEQHRIVQRVEELMAVCDELEQQFVAADYARRDLAASIANHAAQPSVHA